MSSAPSRECTKKYEGHLKFKYLTVIKNCSCLRRNIKFRNPPTDFFIYIRFTALAWLMSCSLFLFLKKLLHLVFHFCKLKIMWKVLNLIIILVFLFYFIQLSMYFGAAQQLLPLSLRYSFSPTPIPQKASKNFIIKWM